MKKSNSPSTQPKPKTTSSEQLSSRKKRLRINDKLADLENNLSGAAAVIDILTDKAHYFLDLCIDAGVISDRARTDYKELCETLAPELKE